MTALRAWTAGLVCFTPAAAQAYVGPGAGLSAVGTLLILAAAVLLAIVGFVWFPVRHLIKNWKNRRKIGGEPAKKAVNEAAADETEPA